MKFYTNYDRPKSKPEEMDPISKTDKVGYVSAKERIETIMLAGQKLVDYRNGLYDYPDGVEMDDSVQVDPTRKGLDLAEASEIQQSVTESINDAVNKATDKKETEDTVNIQESVVESNTEASEAIRE